MCFGGVALEGGRKAGVVFFGLDTFKIKLTAGFPEFSAIPFMGQK